MKKRNRKLLLNKNSIANLATIHKVKGGGTSLDCVIETQQNTCTNYFTMGPLTCNTTGPDTNNATGISCDCNISDNQPTVGTSCSVC